MISQSLLKNIALLKSPIKIEDPKLEVQVKNEDFSRNVNQKPENEALDVTPKVDPLFLLDESNKFENSLNISAVSQFQPSLSSINQETDGKISQEEIPAERMRDSQILILNYRNPNKVKGQRKSQIDSEIRPSINIPSLFSNIGANSSSTNKNEISPVKPSMDKIVEGNENIQDKEKETSNNDAIKKTEAVKNDESDNAIINNIKIKENNGPNKIIPRGQSPKKYSQILAKSQSTIISPKKNSLVQVNGVSAINNPIKNSQVKASVLASENTPIKNKQVEAKQFEEVPRSYKLLRRSTTVPKNIQKDLNLISKKRSLSKNKDKLTENTLLNAENPEGTLLKSKKEATEIKIRNPSINMNSSTNKIQNNNDSQPPGDEKIVNDIKPKTSFLKSKIGAFIKFTNKTNLIAKKNLSISNDNNLIQNKSSVNLDKSLITNTSNTSFIQNINTNNTNNSFSMSKTSNSKSQGNIFKKKLNASLSPMKNIKNPSFTGYNTNSKNNLTPNQNNRDSKPTKSSSNNIFQLSSPPAKSYSQKYSRQKVSQTNFSNNDLLTNKIIEVPNDNLSTLKVDVPKPTLNVLETPKVELSTLNALEITKEELSTLNVIEVTKEDLSTLKVLEAPKNELSILKILEVPKDELSTLNFKEVSNDTIGDKKNVPTEDVTLKSKVLNATPSKLKNFTSMRNQNTYSNKNAGKKSFNGKSSSPSPSPIKSTKSILKSTTSSGAKVNFNEKVDKYYAKGGNKKTPAEVEGTQKQEKNSIKEGPLNIFLQQLS